MTSKLGGPNTETKRETKREATRETKRDTRRDVRDTRRDTKRTRNECHIQTEVVKLIYCLGRRWRVAALTSKLCVQKRDTKRDTNMYASRETRRNPNRIRKGRQTGIPEGARN